MIINEDYRFVFVHIPKCAGTSVRLKLRPFDSREGAFEVRGNHPILGRLDYGHLPLFTVSEYFQSEFNTLRNYFSFAVVRDPFARFPSSVSQHLSMYSQRAIHMCSSDEIQAAIDTSIHYLRSQPRDRYLLPPHYIHFQKQTDYINLDGVRIIDRLYTVGKVNALLADVGQLIGQSLVHADEAGHEIAANRSIVFRNDLLRKVIAIMRPVSDLFGKYIPDNMKQKIRNQVYVPRDDRLREIFDSDYIKDFIRDYYAEDIVLHQELTSQKKDDM